jgi:hypothetical protein
MLISRSGRISAGVELAGLDAVWSNEVVLFSLLANSDRRCQKSDSGISLRWMFRVEFVCAVNVLGFAGSSAANSRIISEADRAFWNEFGDKGLCSWEICPETLPELAETVVELAPFPVVVGVIILLGGLYVKRGGLGGGGGSEKCDRDPYAGQEWECAKPMGSAEFAKFLAILEAWSEFVTVVGASKLEKIDRIVLTALAAPFRASGIRGAQWLVVSCITGTSGEVIPYISGKLEFEI